MHGPLTVKYLTHTMSYNFPLYGHNCITLYIHPFMNVLTPG